MHFDFLRFLLVCYLFWNTYRLTRSWEKKYTGRFCAPFTQLPPVVVPQTGAQPGNRCWYNPQSLFRFHWFDRYSSLPVFVSYFTVLPHKPLHVTTIKIQNHCIATRPPMLYLSCHTSSPLPATPTTDLFSMSVIILLCYFTYVYINGIIWHVTLFNIFYCKTHTKFTILTIFKCTVQWH